MVKIAVVTRTKDRPVFLKRAIESVASQTFNDFTHVIVNDGGDKQELEAVIDELTVDVRDKIVVFHREVPSGAPDTIFNESIDRVDSEYFAIHDDDDTWHAEFLAETVGLLDKNKHLGAVVVRTDKVVEAVEGSSIRHKKRTQWMPDVKAVSLYRQCIDNQMTPISTLFRRSAYVEVGKFDDSLPVVGDWEFGVRLLMKYDVDFIDPGYALANYHHRINRRVDSQANISSHDKHRFYTNKVMNRYLREELDQNRLGVGFIMSQLKYNQSNLAATIGRVLPKFLIDRVKNRVRN